MGDVVASPEVKGKFLSVAEAADELSIHKSTLYALIEKNQVPYRRIPGTGALRLAPEDVAAIKAAAYCPPIQVSA